MKPSPLSLSVPFLFLAVLPACSSDVGASSGGTSSSAATAASSSATGAGAGGGACTEAMFGGDRPVALHVPKSYDCGTPAPLVIMLHGYSASGLLEEQYLAIAAESEARGFLYAHPDGTKDTAGEEFWNATDACCNFYGSTVDDSAYILGLIDAIEGAYNVDAGRVYLVGHSNGAFMSYRMACDHADRITAVAALAGAMFVDTSKCAAKEPVSVLAIHGTADTTVAYDGGAIVGNAFPSAMTTITDWAANDGCDMTPDTSGAPLDLESTLAGSETSVLSYDGCKGGSSVVLWSIAGGSHIPSFTPEFVPDVFNFLYAHKKF